MNNNTNHIFSNIIEENQPTVTSQISDSGVKVQSVNFAEVVLPKYVESKSVDYVLNGKNHEYARFLIDLQNKSSIHRSITIGKAQMIAGEGITIDKTNSPVLSEQMESDINSWFANVNSNGESINEVLKKCAKDYSILNYAAINVIWSKDKSRIAEIYHLDASTVAFGKNNSSTNIPDYYYVSNDWSNIKKEENIPVRIPAFNPNKRGDASQIIIIKGYDTGSVYYSQPDYASASNYILVDFEIGQFHLANLSNGMVPSMWVSFNNGKPANPEEEETIYNEIKSAYGGAKNAGKIIVTYSNSKDNAPQYQMLNPSDSDKQFIMLNDSVTAQILRGHRANPVLFQSNPGTLGQSTELINASELFYNQVIAPTQLLFESTFENIIKINGYNDVKLTIKDSQPISFQLSESGLIQTLTRDELRAKLGYKPQQKQNEKLLIETIGIGGVQALQSILLSPMETEQKVNTLVIVFGLTEEQARKMVGNQDQTQTQSQSTNNNLTTNDNNVPE